MSKRSLWIGLAVVAIVGLAVLLTRPDPKLRDQTTGPRGSAELFGDFGTTTGRKDAAGSAAMRALAARLHRELPGNLFLPPLNTEPDRTRIEKRNHRLVSMRAIHQRLLKKRASAEERDEYFRFRARYNRDRIKMLRYIALKQQGRLPAHIRQMISVAEAEIRLFEKGRLPPPR